MPTIDTLVPERGAYDTAALHAHDPDTLVDYVADVRNAWWRRRICAHALAGRAAAGLAPKPPLSCGEHQQQGGGTYGVIECDGENVLVSTLGRFAMSHDHHHAARLPLEEAGFRWIDEETADTEVIDLGVSYFGGRGTRDVDTLLFLWQD